ncbi:MAG: YebC/PmpR family DNA-binding transcriptional regulator [Bacilli bacterium]
MGRAYEVRKASIQKTGASKAKLYSMYAKEIYQSAKQGGVEIEGNATLKRLIERAKKEQVPADIIKRAIDKVNSGILENYDAVRYEIFGPGGATLIVECLTDNVNRTLSYIRPALNKNNGQMGKTGSVAYMYDHLCVVGFKGLTEDETLELMIENDIDIIDIMVKDSIIVYGKPTDLFKIKAAINNKIPHINFDIDEIEMKPKDQIVLEGEASEQFEKMLIMLDDVSDVKQVYHNVLIK